MLLKKSSYKIPELYEEWKDKLTKNKLDYVFNNKINYGIYLDTFITVALVKTSGKYIPVAACVVDGVVDPNQPVINTSLVLWDTAIPGGVDPNHPVYNTKHYSLEHWANLRKFKTRDIERIKFLPRVAKIYEWDESKPVLVQTESHKNSQELAENARVHVAVAHGTIPPKFPSFDELHKQGALKPEDYNVEGNSIFNSGDLGPHLHKFFRLRKNIDSWNPLQRNEVNEDELYFYFLDFENNDLCVLHEDRMKIEKSFNSSQGATKEGQQNPEDQPVETSIKKPPGKSPNRINELINEEDIKLWEKMGKKPVAGDVWKQLEFIQGAQNNCIIKIENLVLHWKNIKGKEVKFKRTSLSGTLTRLRKARAENKKVH